MVRFSIYGENFKPTYITEVLGIAPSEAYTKGEKTKNGKLIRKDTSWSINTGYQDSLDINEQLEIIITQLEKKVAILTKIKQDLSVEMLFIIVIRIEDNEIPAMYFKKDFIRFISKIDAEVGFDTYIYS